ncbi:hypothetical protein FACS1894217_05620 [Clostridia bacterium]|nr:hypothetical protein FACS1894217_05620 [Clostridia bacterium]
MWIIQGGVTIAFDVYRSNYILWGYRLWVDSIAIVLIAIALRVAYVFLMRQAVIDWLKTPMKTNNKEFAIIAITFANICLLAMVKSFSCGFSVLLLNALIIWLKIYIISNN